MEQHDGDNELKKGEFTNVFCSYYYLRSKKWDKISDVARNTKSIIVDSGAHTFFSEVDNGDPNSGLSASMIRKKTKTKASPDEYFDGYIKWLEIWKDKIDYFVELDIGELVGQKKVLLWRKMLEDKGLLHKCITVYHPRIMTYRDYLEDIKNSKSRYVALEGDRLHRKRLPYTQLIEPAYAEGVRVHGFAIVKPQIINSSPFYSVDSSSWSAGSRFGTLMACIGRGQLKSVKLNQLNKSLLALIAVGVDHIEDVHHVVKQSQRDKRYQISIRAYKALQDYYTELWKLRGIDWEAKIGKKV